MSKQPDLTTLVDGVLAAAAHLEPELEEALAEHHLSRPSFQVLSALLDADAPRAHPARADGPGAPDVGHHERAPRAPGARRPGHARARRRGPPLGHGHADRQRARGRRGRAPGLRAGGGSASPPASPTTRARRFGEQLAAWLGFFEPDDGVAPRLGVAVAPAAVASRMRRAVGLPDRHGILVLKVKRSSAADTAGIARGDLVTGAGGAEVRTIGDLHRAVRHARGTLALDVVRGVEERSVEVALSRSS